MDKQTSDLPTYNPIDDFTVGSYVDARDSVNRWCVAIIKTRFTHQERVTVRFDGWSSSWDETYSIKGDKVAPFRRFSRNYTGQTKFAIREGKFSLEETQELSSEITRLIANNLRLDTAWEITQFYRGKLYTYVDIVLCETQLTKTSTASIVEFLAKVVELIVIWLKMFPSLLPAYHEGCANPTLFYTDIDVALASCLPEMLHTLRRILGDDERCGKIFLRNIMNPPASFKASESQFVEKRSSVSRVQMYLTHLFGELEGFQAFMEIVQTCSSENPIPLDFFAEFPMATFSEILNHQFIGSIFDGYKDSVLTRISSISVKELKDLDKDTYTNMLENVRALMSVVQDDNASYQFLENMELDLALKFIKCEYMERRIKGINEIKDYIKKTKGYYRTYNNQNYAAARWLTQDRLVQWILDQNLVKILLIDYSHVEVIKRSSDIVKFLGKKGALQDEILDLIFVSIQGKHDSIIRATYSLIVDIADDLDPQQCKQLFDKLASVPIAEWDEKLIETFRDFSEKAGQRKSMTGERQLYALPLLYQNMLDDSPLPAALAYQATVALCDLLSGFQFAENRDNYLRECFDNLVHNVSVPQSLSLAMEIINSYQDYRTTQMHETKYNVIMRHNKMHGLVQAVIDNITLFITKVKQTYGGQVPENIHKVAVEGSKYQYDENIQKRLDFLAYITLSTNFSLELTVQEVHHLWEIFVKEPLHPKDSDIFFAWLSKKYLKVTSRPYLLRPQVMEEVFESFLCNPSMFNPKTLGLSGLDCFIKFFKQINEEDNRISIEANKSVKRVATELIGLDTLWDIAISADDENVRKLSMDLLVNLFVQLSSQLRPYKTQIWDQLLTKIFGTASATNASDEAVHRCLELTMKFIDRYEGKGEKMQLKQQTYQYNFNFNIEVIKDRSNRKTFKVNTTTPVGSFRKSIAGSFEMDPTKCELRANGDKLLDVENDDMPMRTYLHCNYITISKIEENKNDINPRQMISNKAECIILLLNLLSQPNKSYQTIAWNLLSRLPTNERVKEEVRSLQTEFLTNSRSLHKLLYYLKIIEEIAKDAKNAKWKQEFEQRGYLQELLNIFLTTTPEIEKGRKLAVKYSGTILNVLLLFLANSSTDQTTIEINRMVKMILSNINNVCNCIQGDTLIEKEDFEKIPQASTQLITLLTNYAEENEVITAMVEYEHFDELLVSSLVKIQYDPYGSSTVTMWGMIFANMKLQRLMMQKLLGFMPSIIAQSDIMPYGYFKLTKFVVEKSEHLEDVENFISILSTALKTYPFETSVKEQNNDLIGLLELLNSLLKKSNGQERGDLIEYVLHDCLFDIPSASEVNKPKCKHPSTRKAAFTALETLMSAPEHQQLVLSFLNEFHQDPSWRSKRRQDWSITPTSMEKSDTGFVGIKNLGCICYMNSIFQQLFSIRNFRNAMLDLEDKQTDVSLADNMLYQFQYIFASLQNSAKQYVNPKDFCHSFKDWDGNPINVMEQMDVEEFFTTLMDRIENLSSETKHKNLIKDAFGGKLVTEIIGQETCQHKSEREEPLIRIQLQVKNMKSVAESLEAFIEGELLQQDNAYQCDYCEAKVTALKRQCIKRLPNTLIIILQRFEFDLDTMERVKVNDRFEFPNELNMEPYTQEGIERRERQASEDYVASEADEKAHPDDYYNYKLKGVVIHMGTAESGHYYSLIQDRAKSDEIWHEYNDTIVRPFDMEDMPGEAFGGEEKISWSGSSNIVSLREKYRNAYLLFYERETFYDTSKEGNGPLDVLVPPTPSRQPPKAVQSIIDQVKEDNERYWRGRNTFSNEYFHFVLNLQQRSVIRDEINLTIYKFIANCYLTILVRSRDRGLTSYMMQQLYKYMQPEAAEWLCEVF